MPVTAAASPADRRLIYAAAFLRATAVGLVGVLAGLWLTRLRLGAAEIGAVVGAGLAGNALATAWAMADTRLGARRLLAATAVLGAAGGAAFSFASHPAALALTAFLGMLNGMGRDRGPALVLEQTLLPSTTDDAGRTRALAFHSLALDAGHALGALLAGLPTLLASAHLADGLAGLRVSLWLYAALLLAGAAVYPRLSAAVEPPPRADRVPLSPGSRRVVWRICALFGLDGLGGGFLTSALLSYFFGCAAESVAGVGRAAGCQAWRPPRAPSCPRSVREPIARTTVARPAGATAATAPSPAAARRR